jgi:two-component system response regulator FixJ
LAARGVIAARYVSLTPREREVMAQVVAGEPNKVIARNLDLSAKTIEAHRAAVMRKMEADSLAGLVHMAISCEEVLEQS